MYYKDNSCVSAFEYYSSLYGDSINRKCINNCVTSVSNCVGFCDYYEHRGFLTKKMRTDKKCIEKGCKYYSQKVKNKKINKQKFGLSNEMVMSVAQDVTKEYEGIKIIKADTEYYNHWNVRYISISSAYDFIKIKNAIEKRLNCIINMVDLKYPFDTCVKIIMED